MSKLIVRKNKKKETTPSFDGLSGLLGRRVNREGVKVGSLEGIETTNPHKIDIEYDQEILEVLDSLIEDDFVKDFFDKNESKSRRNSDTPKGQFNLVMGDKEDYDLDDIIRITNRLNEESPLVTFVDSENTLLNTISLKTLNYMVDMYGSLIRDRFKSEFPSGLSKYEENKRVKNILLDPEKFKTFDSVYELTFQLYFNRFKQEADNEINEGMIRLINEKGETNINDMMNFLYDRRGIEDTPITNRHRVSGFVTILSDESYEDTDAPDLSEDEKEKFIESLLVELTRLGYELPENR